jgi:hypothetical protein
LCYFQHVPHVFTVHCGSSLSDLLGNDIRHFDFVVSSRKFDEGFPVRESTAVSTRYLQ